MNWLHDGAVAAARAEIKRASEGKYQATLEDAIRWEKLGLGRCFFELGKPTWYPDETKEGGAA